MLINLESVFPRDYIFEFQVRQKQHLHQRLVLVEHPKELAILVFISGNTIKNKSLANTTGFATFGEQWIHSQSPWLACSRQENKPVWVCTYWQGACVVECFTISECSLKAMTAFSGMPHLRSAIVAFFVKTNDSQSTDIRAALFYCTTIICQKMITCQRAVLHLKTLVLVFFIR